MTDQSIHNYIDLLNNGNNEESIFIRQISQTVDIAKVWDKQPNKTDNIIGNFSSYRFFFIRDDSNQYVGAVLDMYNDLHWYIIPQNRKQGHLTKALKEAIIPYLFYNGRQKQRITISRKVIGKENYINSKKVALKLGFTANNKDETEFELKESNFNWEDENLNEINSEVRHQRFEELRKRAFYAYKILYKISDELLMTIDDDKNLLQIAKEVKKYTWKIEDLECEYLKE